MVKKAASRIYLAVIFLFLYLPILVLVVLSFNNSKSRVVWGGFTLKWYASCFTDKTIMNALIMTLQITLCAAEQIGDHERGKSRNENHDDSADHAGECQRKDNADQYDP